MGIRRKTLKYSSLAKALIFCFAAAVIFSHGVIMYIVEASHLCLAIAIAFSGINLLQPRSIFLSSDKPLTVFFYSSLGFFVLAFTGLIYAFLTLDFSVQSVAMHSHPGQTAFYRLIAVWGHHEGSMLLWLMMLFGTGVLIKQQNLSLALQKETLRFLSGIIVVYGLYTLVFSNPFTRLFPPPIHGNGLNPLLLDPSLAIHPPGLYAGIVMTASLFSLVIGTILTKTPIAAIVVPLKQWCLFTLIVLSIGIMLGSRWAYYELGWGGWWFWDPVENISLLPWLALLGLLHSLKVLKKYPNNLAWQRWSCALSLLPFLLAAWGTFIVRADLITSVHSFASSPWRGIVLGLIALSLSLIAILLYKRLPQATQNASMDRLARGISLQNIILITVLGTLVLGILYGTIVEQLSTASVSVGPQYYHFTVVPMLWGLCGILPALFLAKRWLKISIFCTVILLGLAWWPHWRLYHYAAILTGSVIAIIGGKIWWQAKTKQHLATALTHGGLGLFIVAVVVSTYFRIDTQITVTDAQATARSNQNIALQLESIKTTKQKDFIETTYTTIVEGQTLKPSQRFYPVQDYVSSEADIDIGLWRDIHVTFSQPFLNEDDQQAWRVYIKKIPLMLWIWLSAGIIVIGLIIGLWDSIYEKR